MARFILLLVGLLSCTRSNRPTETAAATITKPDLFDTLHSPAESVDKYSAALVYTDTDSDSLLIDDEDFGNLISIYRNKGKLVKEREYGGGDCAGKYKQYALQDGQLTINKSSCGDYGFGDSEFLMKNDSLLRVRKYEVQWNVLSKDDQLEISEKIFIFNNGRLTLKERYKTTGDWNGFDFRNIPFKSGSMAGHKEYDDLKKELAGLLTYEIIDE